VRGQLSLGPRGAELSSPKWFGLEAKWWGLIAVGIANFMTALYSAVVNTVIPLIMGSFGVDFAMAEWVVMAYLLGVSSLILTFGRMGDMIGHKRVFLLGSAIFSMGSVLCGLAPTVEVLIGGRLVQAVGAAMLFASSSAILIDTFPATQRGQVLGLQGSITYVGMMLGPAAGGWMAMEFGWQGVFYLSVPLGILMGAIAYFAIPRTSARKRDERFDVAGALTFMIGLGALLMALSHGQKWGWTSSLVLALLLAAALLLGAFVSLERRIDNPMLDLSLFRVRVFNAATGSALMNYLCTYSVMFLVPFYLIQYRGFNPAHSGLLLSCQAVAMAAVAPFSGSLSDRIGSRLLSSFGMAVLTVGLLLLAFVSPTAADGEIAVRLAICGLGIGIFVSPNSSALMGSVSVQRRGVASAILAGARTTGMVMGVALAGAVFSTALAIYGGTLGPSSGFMPAFRDAFLAAALCGAIGLGTSMVRGGREGR